MSPTFFLMAWFVLPLLAWAALLLVRRLVGPVLLWFVCLSSIAVGIFLLANYVWALDAQLLAEVDKYEPGTPEAQRASEEWASDTDRSLVLLVSPVLTAVWYGILFTALFGLQWVVSRLLPAKKATEKLSLQVELAEERGDDGNPYKPSHIG